MNITSVRERLERGSRRRRNTHRFRQIASVAVRYGLADRLRKMPSKRMQQWLRGSAGQSIVDLATPVRLRLALGELGTTFIKFGQMLSTRPDLVGQDVADELAHLQSRTPPDPPGVAEATIQRELGSPPATLFASFDPTPFASASIAQVHYARLHSGESVVVKVQKDGIESLIDADLSMLADLAALAERYVDDLKPYHPVAVVRQFTKMMRAELDFLREVRNLQQFRQNFAADDTVHFPLPYPELCSRRVLTMERLEGVLVSQVKTPPGPNPEMDEFARRGANMYLEMIFRDGFYHADPHPGNLMLLPDGVLGVLDCGMVQRMDDDLREAIEDLLLAAVRRDPQTVTEAVWDLCTTPPTTERQRLFGFTEYADLLDLLRGTELPHHVFTYDWRRDLVASARRLGATLDALAESSGDPAARFDVIGHSMGGLVARYYLRFGDAEPDSPVTWAGARRIRNLVLVATPSGGSIASLDAILNGNRVGLSSTTLAASVIATMPSIYQLLPPAGVGALLDHKHEPLHLDLHDAGTWERFGWGPFAPSGTAHRRPLPKATDDDAARANLVAALARARAFHLALARPVPGPCPVRVVALGGDCLPTLARALVAEKRGGVPRFEPGTRAESTAMMEAGDGRVTRASVLAAHLPEAETSDMGSGVPELSQAFFGCADHHGIYGEPTFQSVLLRALLRPARRSVNM